MAFGKKVDEKPKSIEDYFKDVDEFDDNLHLHMLIYGRMKVGKTHLSMTSIFQILQYPDAKLYIIDTEGEANLIAKAFQKKYPETTGRFKIFRALHWADKKKGKVDLLTSLSATFEAMDVLTDLMFDMENNHSIVIVDSASDIWEWLSTWLETIETKHNKDGSMNRTEWGKANKRYLDFIYMLLSTNVHVIMTAIAHPAIDERGADLNNDAPKWQKNTGRYFNLICEIKKLGDERRLYFRGDRWGDISREFYLKDPDWKAVKEKVSKHSGVDFN
jgi:hypothetical protein